MRILIIGLVVLALSVAGISTYLIQSFSTPEAIDELEKKSRRAVYHTLVSLYGLEPGGTLTKDNMVWREWPEESLSEHYITVEEDAERDEQFQDVLDSVARKSIQAGEPILRSKIFKSDEAGFLAGILDKGTRAISLQINENTAVAGFILPGDRVDVLVVHGKGREAVQKILTAKTKAKLQNETNNADDDNNAGNNAAEVKAEPLTVLNSTTETILENVLVLAVNQSLGKVEGNTIAGKTLTLQVSPKEAEILMTARTLGTMSFALRALASHPSEKVAMGDDGDGDGNVVQSEKAGTTSGAFVGKSYIHDVDVSPFLTALTSGALEEESEAERLKIEEAKKLLESKLKAEIAEAELAAAKAANIAAMAKSNVAEAEATISKANEEAAAIAKQNEELLRMLQEQAAKNNEPDVVIQKIITPVAKPVVKPVVVEEPTVITIYRGGSRKTEEIEFK